MNIGFYRVLFYLGQVFGLVPRHGLYVTTDLGFVVFVRGKLRAWYRGQDGSYLVIDPDGGVRYWRDGWWAFVARVRQDYCLDVSKHLKWLSEG